MSWHWQARLGRMAGWALVWVVLFYITLPSLIVMATAFSDKETLAFPPTGFSMRWFVKALTYPEFQSALRNSTIVAVMTSVIATIVGTCYAYAIERYNFAGKRIITALLLSPLIIPHFILGLAFLVLAIRLNTPRSYETLVITHVMLVLPFVMRSVIVSLKAMDRNYERAAASLGAPPARIFVRITLPLLAPGIFGGWIFAIVLSFTEFSGSLFVASQRTQPLPVAMFTYIRDVADPTMAALGTLFLVVVVAMLVVAARWFGLASILSSQHEGH